MRESLLVASDVDLGGASVVHCRREPHHVYIGRYSKWGNPFRIGSDGTREEVIRRYERYLAQQPQLLADLPELRGKTLGCWCAPQACHGDVLLRLANAMTSPSAGLRIACGDAPVASQSEDLAPHLSPRPVDRPPLQASGRR